MEIFRIKQNIFSEENDIFNNITYQIKVVNPDMPLLKWVVTWNWYNNKTPDFTLKSGVKHFFSMKCSLTEMFI